MKAILVILTGILLLATKAIESQPKPSPDCLGRCGSVSIPYPFGTEEGCYLDKLFLVECNSSTSTPKLTFPNSSVPILSISLAGELQIGGSIARGCYDKYGNLTNNEIETVAETNTYSRFPISTTRNKFISAGCNSFGTIMGSERGRNYLTGCMPGCYDEAQIMNESCNGFDCCQMTIPQGVVDYATFSYGLLFETVVGIYSKTDACSYVFVADQTYNVSDITSTFQNGETVPVVLDWSVANHTCQQAKQNAATYACYGEHTECVDLVTNGPGYRCQCSSGFDGNPYLQFDHGCQDINECESGTSSPCVHPDTCENLSGSFKCYCPKGYQGDGRSNGKGCYIKDDHTNQTSQNLGIALGICLGILLLLVGGSWIYWGLKKRKLIQLKEKFFQQNGGFLLKQQLSRYKSSVEAAKIYTADELNKATNNYDENRILGQGGNGTVFKGVLADHKLVAIKKSKIGNQIQIEQFINEVVVLSQINHRNVVKLIGCCLETEVPLLVYEFITNGTLSQHLHGNYNCSLLSWEIRLKIATETASALAYLHFSASMPIIHRDVKTANILLDANYTAKVADFGASRLFPLDQTQLTTLVQGTFGYLDPEYFHSSQLTEKSDVYSFGVVLAELLTGEKAVCFKRPESHRNLANYFVASMKEDLLLQILDKRIAIDDDDTVQKVKVVANLARRCLRVKGEERPTMKEVATELEGLNKKMHNRLGLDDLTSLEYSFQLLGPSYFQTDEDDSGTSWSCTASGFDSLKKDTL